MKVKKILASMLACFMIVSMMGLTAFAAEDTDIIKVGADQEITTWADAVVAAADTDGDGAITYHIYGKVEVPNSGWVSPRGKSGATTINFVGMTQDAEISLVSTKSSIIATDGVKDMAAINYTNLILTKLNGFWANDLAHANQFFTTWMRGAANGVVTYTNCTFTNGTCANTYNETVYTGCVFKNPTSNALWIMGGDVTVTGGIFEAAKGAKTYNDNPKTVIDAEFSDCTFDIELTPAVIVSAIGEVALEKVDATECEYGILENGVAGGAIGSVSIDGEAPSYVATTSNKYGVTIYTTDAEYAEAVKEEAIKEGKESEVVEINPAVVATTATKSTFYASLQEALDNAGTGDTTIHLLTSVDTDVTVSQKADTNITIVGKKGVDFTSTVYIEGNARYNDKETLTFKNINFVTDEADHDFISSNKTDAVGRYAHNVTVDGCTFTATGEGEYTAVGLRIRQGKNINVINSTFTGLHSVMWATGTLNIVVDEIEATGNKNGISAGGASTGFVVKNSEITAVGDYGYAIRTEGNGAYDLVVENCELTADAPILVRKATSDTAYALTVSESTLTSTSGEGFEIVLSKTDYDKEIAIEEPEVGVKLTLDDDYDVSASFMAECAGVYYKKFEDAVKAAKVGETVNLLTDVKIANTIKIDKNIIIEGNGNTIAIDYSVFPVKE